MKLQGFIVIFIIIILPIVLVLSVYLHGQIDTIALQTQYDNALLNATYDAIMSLEHNTANENLSTVSDELRSMVDASTSIFMNTLSTSMGMSNANESSLKPYIPALLYTLYDGFYIYSPTMVPVVLERPDGRAAKAEEVEYGLIPDSSDNKHKTYEYDLDYAKTALAQIKTNYDDKELHLNKVSNIGVEDYGQLLYKVKNQNKYRTIIDENTEYKIDYVLKPYIYYNANYAGDIPGDTSKKFNLSVNYSLDNFVSISGYIDDAYYSKSGYLIDYGLVEGWYLRNNIVDGRINGVVFNIYDSKLNMDEEQFYNAYGEVLSKINPESSEITGLRTESVIDDFCNLDGIRLELHLKDMITGETIIIANEPYESKANLIDLRDTMKNQTDGEVVFRDAISLLDSIINNSDENVLIKQELDIFERIYYYLEDDVKNGTDTSWFDPIRKRVIQKNEVNQQALDSIAFYAKAQMFTEWVNEYLGDLCKVNPSKHLKNNYSDYVATIAGKQQILDLLKVDCNIFDFKESSPNYGGSPEDETSGFYNHKREIIKASIQYNLNSAISNYNTISEGITNTSYDFEMPILSDYEWDKVLSNISLTSFFQGYPCKGKFYNNYAIVASTSSEMMINSGNIYTKKSYIYNTTSDSSAPAARNAGNLYFVVATEADTQDGKFHRIDCSDDEFKDVTGVNDVCAYLGYKSIDYVYDRYLPKGKEQYEYDHRNFACYKCIINGNYDKKDWNQISNEKKKAYYIALGAEKNNLHKTTASVENYGFEIINFDDPGKSFKNHDTSDRTYGFIEKDISKEVNEIRKIEIVFGETSIPTRKSAQNVELAVRFNNDSNTTRSQIKLSANQKNNKTIEIENVYIDSNVKSLRIDFFADPFVDARDNTHPIEFYVKSIKVIYK